MNVDDWKAMVPRYVLLVFLMITYSSATSVVAKPEKHRIILAADTRQDRLDTLSGKSHQAFHDDGCKILPLDASASGVSGNMDYKRNDPSDGVPDWDALSDARAAYALPKQDLQAMAAAAEASNDRRARDGALDVLSLAAALSRPGRSGTHGSEAGTGRSVEPAAARRADRDS
jgi:hypothetical protein